LEDVLSLDGEANQIPSSQTITEQSQQDNPNQQPEMSRNAQQASSQCTETVEKPKSKNNAQN